MKTYTVVALEENEGQCITETVEAPSPNAAMVLFAEARASTPSIVIVDVLEGECKSVHSSGFAISCSWLIGGEK